jgi:DNA-binding MarR family transcriptional regulator
MEKKPDKLIEEMLEDSIIYIKLFNRELINLSERKFMKTFAWLILIEQYGNPSMSVLGKTLNISKTQMTAKIDELVDDGLIERVPDENDRRVLRIVLTSHGKNLIKKSHKTVTEGMNQLLSPLSHKELEELNKSIGIIKNAVLKIQGVK